MENKKIVKFSYNWNNKLCCKAFTTVRRWNPVRFAIGSTHEIYLNNEFRGVARVVYHRGLVFDQFNDCIAMLDTGYTLDEFKEILKKMYPDAESKQFSFVVLKYTQTSQMKLF